MADALYVPGYCLNLITFFAIKNKWLADFFIDQPFGVLLIN